MYYPTHTPPNPKTKEITMMTGRINNHNYRLMLEMIKKAMEEHKVKPTSKADNEEKPKKD